MSLLSDREHRARRVEFHPKRNLISGLNHTGKSTLIKMLFETLGASPSGKLEGWDTAAICLLTIEIDGVVYRVLRQGQRRALFSENNRLVRSTGTARDWAEQFNKLTDFNLLLTDKQENTTRADPSCFFLPYYINQDGSWGASWGTFRSLRRFKSPVKSILDFF